MKTRILLSALLATAAVAVTANSVAAAPGGRIELTADMRVIDTRNGIGVPSVGPVTELELGTGILSVVVPGSPRYQVFVCADGPTTGEFAPPGITRYHSSEQLCLEASQPVTVTVDKFGDVSETPGPSGVQYVALPQAVSLTRQFTADDANSILRLARPTQLSATAVAAVLAIETAQVLGSGSGFFVSAFGCDGAQRLGADLLNTTTAGGSVVSVALEPGEDICISSFRPMPIQVELLGELNAEGSDETALPPSYTLIEGDVFAPTLAPINPVRVLDSRSGDGSGGLPGKVAKDDILRLEVLRSEFPPGAVAVSLNVTAAGAEAGGFLSVWDCDGPRPTISNLNFETGKNVANLVIAELGDDEFSDPNTIICLSASATTHMIADVTGVFIPDGGYSAVVVDPTRVLDTRDGTGAPVGTLGAGETLELQVTGSLVPAEGLAVTMNVTAVNADDKGFLTIYPCDRAKPTASSLNYEKQQNRANLVLTQLSADGKVCIFTSQTTHVLGDIATWFGDDEPNGLIATSPERILDTRSGAGVPSAGKVAPSDMVTLDVGAASGVTSESSAVVMNLTVVNPDGKGFATVWPCDQTKPIVSNLNFEAGQNVPNLTTVKISAAGTVCIQASQTTHFVGDVTGSLSEQTVKGTALVRR